MRPLNLSSQPFRNETLPALLLVVGGLALFLVTVRHALVIRRLLPAHTSAVHREMAALEEEAARLRTEGRSLRVPRPDAGTVAHWAVLKELVDRRAFSWTGLFSVLEEVLPPGVRLQSIAPKVSKGEVTLELAAVARSYEEGLELISVLEDRPEFADVYPLSRGDEAESRFRYTMRYLPPSPEPVGMPALETPAPASETETGPGSSGRSAVASGAVGQ